MTFEFGSLQVDEPGRVLRLAEQEVPLQPRIFDLLVYLVRHRSRVVSKEELLDALWPGVIVTDNSLQRAVSVLRTALRAGGMEDAVRNFPRAGYRFCADDLKPAEDRIELHGVAELSNARKAMEEQRWDQAAAGFSQVDRQGALEGDDLDQWGAALLCLGRPADAIPVLARAVATHGDGGQCDAAAVSATILSSVHLERGEAAVASGWVARASELVLDRPGSAAAARVLWMKSRLAASSEGEPRKALELAGAAYELAQRHGDIRTASLGLMYRGFYKLSLGRTREGLADQDHAATLALSNKVDPLTGGVLYCNVLWACRTFGDWARANQWTMSYQDYCTSSGMQFTGSCQLHRAEVLGVRGTLRDALDHITDALAKLNYDAPWAAGDAHRVLGDIHAAMGDHETALDAYQTCYGLGWSPEPGHAMLLCEQGRTDAALACLERSLIGQGWWTLQRQGVLLAHLALVCAHAGQEARSRELINDLTGQDDRWPMPSIRALTNEASALLAYSAGDGASCIKHLHLARQLWTSIDARIDAARLRVQIAERLIEAGDASGAKAEMRAACLAAEILDSDKLRAQCGALRSRLGEHMREP